MKCNVILDVKISQNEDTFHWYSESVNVLPSTRVVKCSNAERRLVNAYIDPGGTGEYSCPVNLPQGTYGRVASAAGTTLSSSLPPGTGSAHKSCADANRTVISAVQNRISHGDGDLHRDTGAQLGNIFGLPELFAKSQQVQTELMTSRKRGQKNTISHTYHS